MSTRTTSPHEGKVEQDKYAWLRSANWQEVLLDPRRLEKPIRGFLEKENQLFSQAFAPVLPLKERIFEEIKQRIPARYSSAPLPHGSAHVYYTSYEEGKDHIMYWCNQSVLLDGNEEKRGEYLDIGTASHSDDHQFLAWARDDVGDESYQIIIRDIATGQDRVDEVIERTTGHVEWDALSTGFFYIRCDERHHPSEVFYHKVGTPPASDKLIFREKDTRYFLSISRVQSGDYIVIDSHDHDSNECTLINANSPTEDSGFILIPRKNGVIYGLEYSPENACFFVLTKEGAINFKVLKKYGENFSQESTFIEHDEETLLLEQVVYKDFHVCLCVSQAQENIFFTHIKTGEKKWFPIPKDMGAVYALHLIHGYEYNSPIIYAKVSTLVDPPSTYAYNMLTGELKLLKRESTPADFNRESYTLEREWVPSSRDGALIPLTILRKKETQPLAPCLLYGYGAYGLSTSTQFRYDIFSLVDRGFVYAIAHVRGGKEKGEQWYENGKRFKKKNTFYDFIDCAEFLCQTNVTRPDRLAAHGGSAGGMIMGYVANMRPDLFKIILAQVPFVDVLNTIMDASLPLTPPEWGEWGNPIEDLKAREYICSYSPYDNVKAQQYPHILCFTSVADPRVGYWEPAKWVAKLREESGSKAPILLKTNLEVAGHFGASGRYQKFEDHSFLYAYCVHHLAAPATH